VGSNDEGRLGCGLGWAEKVGVSLRDGMGAGLMARVGEGACKGQLEMEVLRQRGLDGVGGRGCVEGWLETEVSSGAGLRGGVERVRDGGEGENYLLLKV